MNKNIILSIAFGFICFQCAPTWQKDLKNNVLLSKRDYLFLELPLKKDLLGSVLYPDSTKKPHMENFSSCFSSVGEKQIVPLTTIDAPDFKLINPRLEKIVLGPLLENCPVQDGKVHQVVTEQLVIEHFEDSVSAKEQISGDFLTYAVRFSEVTIPKK